MFQGRTTLLEARFLRRDTPRGASQGDLVVRRDPAMTLMLAPSETPAGVYRVG